MSMPVALPELSQAMERYRFAYLLTHSAQGAPHAVAVVPVLEGGVLKIGGIGRRTRQNLLARPDVGLVWPPGDPSGYSLIVDGQAALAGEVLHVVPSRAVLHRPAPRPGPAEPGACGSDCVELPVPAPAGDAPR
ncbi:pyridoxamine 5'-phosphate oxidase family protein [Pseudorhodoferax sp.]|uniref:pyridoxamine 5'-phosphate oxidase family protein n=1 Tax=Pseudorhodoferax sp. TaxID=1993553 RepID=UPI0039E6614D